MIPCYLIQYMSIMQQLLINAKTTYLWKNLRGSLVAAWAVATTQCDTMCTSGFIGQACRVYIPWMAALLPATISQVTEWYVVALFLTPILSNEALFRSHPDLSPIRPIVLPLLVQ